MLAGNILVAKKNLLDYLSDLLWPDIDMLARERGLR